MMAGTQLSEILSTLRFRGGDSAEVEVKRAQHGNPLSLGETLCAFANMPDGGTIILGVDEAQNFAITGVKDIASLEAAITSTNRNYVSPAPHLEFSTVIHNQKKVLIVNVTGLPITERPARYKGKAYLRQSDGDYVMNDAELRQLEVSKLHTDHRIAYDETVVPGTSVADLDQDILAQYLENVRASSRRLNTLSDQDILHTTRVTSRGELTLAGLYAMGKYPQGFHPALGVTAAVQINLGDGRRTADLRDFDGPLPEMLRDILTWVERNTHSEQRYNPDGNLQDRSTLPLTAVRELIANALVHRDLGVNTLGVGKSIQIRINAKGLFIENPGGLRGVSVQQLMSSEHAQAAVNQRLYHIVKNLRTRDGSRVIEGEGGGIREVLEASQKYGLFPPTLSNTGVKFRAILWSAPQVNKPGRTLSSYQTLDGEELNKWGKNVPTIAGALRTDTALSVSQLSEATELSAPQVRYALTPLLKHGVAVMVGQKGSKNTGYLLSPSE